MIVFLLGDNPSSRRYKMLSKRFPMVMVLLLSVFLSLAANDYEIQKHDDGWCTILKYHGSSSNITIPDEIDEYVVTVIGKNAFSANEKLEIVNVPLSVIQIDDSAFSYCRKLKTVNIPNSITSIGNYAFSLCTDLETLRLPSELESLGIGVFMGCMSLKELSIEPGNSTFEIIDGALYNKITKSLEHRPGKLSGSTFSLPKEIVKLQYNSLNNYSNLKTIYLHSSVKAIEDSAIRGKSLENINVDFENRTYSSIKGVLYEIASKKLLIYPEDKRDSSFSIPYGIKVIGDSAFSDCIYLTEVLVPDSVNYIEDYAFDYCTSLESIIIPASVKSIGHSAFESCHSLKSIIIPEGVEKLGDWAFSYCFNLESITLPASLTTIDPTVFLFCDKLKEIIVPNGSYAYNRLVEDGYHDLIKDYVPSWLIE